MSDFTMPILGADMTEGTLLEWLVSPGDAVHHGDIIAVVDTAKSAIDVESFADGVVVELLVEPGTTVPVGTPLAVIDETASITDTAVGTRAAQSPAAVGEAPASPDRNVSAQRAREAVGSLMTRSARDIPHYYVGLDIDVTPALSWLTGVNADRPISRRIVPAALLLRATALAAGDVAEVNGTYGAAGFSPSARVDLGVAVSLHDGGLIAPTMADVGAMGVDEVMSALRDLVSRARRGRLAAADTAPATLTVTNLGEQGVDEVLGIISEPQVALVGFGRILWRAWVVDDMVAPRSIVRATLAADHRVSDGHRGGMFLAALAARLQSPESL